MKKSNMSIYVITHKPYDVLDNEIYVPLQVGAELNKDKNLGFLKDSTGDNISIKNKSFCELTGAYWIWKNSKAKITGLVHYRRYFYNNMFTNKSKYVLTAEDINKTLQKYDCIVCKKSKIPFGTVEKYYAKHHYSKDYDILRKIIKEKYPEYLDSFNKVSKSNYYYNLNMLITRKELFDKYCDWLFDILFEVEKQTDTSEYSDYDKRIYGFLSEILLRVWLEKNKLTFKEFNVYNNEIPFFGQLLKRIVMNCIIPR